jgi:hypothetical protein
MTERGKRLAGGLYIILAISAATSDNSTLAATIFESGTLGTTGITWQKVLEDEPIGSNVNSDVFSGVRFQVMQPVVTTRIGGHVVAPAESEFFGAIVRLTHQNDFPDSGDLSTPDVLGSTVLLFPSPSAEVFGDLSVSLDPGWYALVFGSGLFAAGGDGAMPLNNPDIGNPTYIAWQTGNGWFNLSDLFDVFDFDDFRFVVEGVPEPTSVGLLTAALLFLLSRRSSKLRQSF